MTYSVVGTAPPGRRGATVRAGGVEAGEGVAA